VKTHIIKSVVGNTCFTFCRLEGVPTNHKTTFKRSIDRTEYDVISPVLFAAVESPKDATCKLCLRSFKAQRR
jgi:hypothetical protein